MKEWKKYEATFKVCKRCKGHYQSEATYSEVCPVCANTPREEFKNLMRKKRTLTIRVGIGLYQTIMAMAIRYGISQGRAGQLMLNYASEHLQEVDFGAKDRPVIVEQPKEPETKPEEVNTKDTPPEPAYKPFTSGPTPPFRPI